MMYIEWRYSVFSLFEVLRKLVRVSYQMPTLKFSENWSECHIKCLRFTIFCLLC